MLYGLAESRAYFVELGEKASKSGSYNRKTGVYCRNLRRGRKAVNGLKRGCYVFVQGVEAAKAGGVSIFLLLSIKSI